MDEHGQFQRRVIAASSAKATRVQHSGLKSHDRGYRLASETLKMLPQKPDAILLADIFLQIARLGTIHPLFQPSTGS
jgi:hypothetical protein